MDEWTYRVAMQLAGVLAIAYGTTSCAAMSPLQQHSLLFALLYGAEAQFWQ
jgi:hypothetical protein